LTYHGAEIDPHWYKSHTNTIEGFFSIFKRGMKYGWRKRKAKEAQAEG